MFIWRLRLRLGSLPVVDFHYRMGGKNLGIFHSCQAKGHFFYECRSKQQCLVCKSEFQKCFEVEREIVNKRKLFKFYSKKCGFWEWVREEESSGESSGVDSLANPASEESVSDLSRKFQYQIQLPDENIDVMYACSRMIPL